MRTLLPILIVWAVPAIGIAQDNSAAPTKDAAKPAAAEPAMPPKAGSHIPPDDNFCIQCHGDPDLWDAKTQRLYVARDGLPEDVHWKNGVNCSDCHGGDCKTAEVNQAHEGERLPRCG